MNKPSSKFWRIAATALAGCAMAYSAAAGIEAGAGATATTTAPTPAPAENESIKRIENLARAQAELHLPALNPHQHLQVGPLDARLRLIACATAPAARISSGTKLGDRVLVEVTCDSGSRWRTYVPVRIIGMTSAAVSARVIPAGKVVDAQDLKMVDADQAQLPLGYFEDPQIAIGLTATRAIGSGSVLSAPQFTSAKSIARGQEVTLLASSAGIDIRMAGRALSDGYVNQRIKVKNSSSGKIVEGIARSDRIVEITLQ